MSVKVQGWVWDQPIPTSPKIVLLKLADHADHEGGNVYPSVGSIAKQTALSERQVQRYLKAFVDCGILVIEDHKGGGRGMPRAYRFTFQKGDAYVTHSTNRKGDASDTVSGDKRVTPATEKGDTGDAKRVTPKVVSGTDTFKEPSDESSGTVPPDGDEKVHPFTLLEAMVETLGQDVSILPRNEKGKQLAVAKRLISDGMTEADVRDMTTWLLSQTWMTSGIDFFAIEKYRGKWLMSGKPTRVTPNGSLTVVNGGKVGPDGRTDQERGYRLNPGPKGWTMDELRAMSTDRYDDHESIFGDVIETKGRIAR